MLRFTGPEANCIERGPQALEKKDLDVEQGTCCPHISTVQGPRKQVKIKTKLKGLSVVCRLYSDNFFSLYTLFWYLFLIEFLCKIQ